MNTKRLQTLLLARLCALLLETILGTFASAQDKVRALTLHEYKKVKSFQVNDL